MEQEYDVDLQSEAVTKNFSATEIARLQRMFGDLDIDADADDDEDDKEEELSEEDIALLQRLFTIQQDTEKA